MKVKFQSIILEIGNAKGKNGILQNFIKCQNPNSLKNISTCGPANPNHNYNPNPHILVKTTRSYMATYLQSNTNQRIGIKVMWVDEQKTNIFIKPILTFQQLLEAHFDEKVTFYASPKITHEE